MIRRISKIVVQKYLISDVEGLDLVFRIFFSMPIVDIFIVDIFIINIDL